MRSPTLASALDRPDNGVPLLRLLLAATVVVSHAYAFGGFGMDPVQRWSSNRITGGSLAVALFFALSGILVTRSRVRTRSLPRFLWYRAVRIMPGFWACLVVVGFVLAPLAWWHDHGTLAGFLTSARGPVEYVRHDWLLELRHYDVSGLLYGPAFAGTCCAGFWDGSLWTLIYEAKCYVLLGAAGSLGLLRRRVVVLALCVALLALPYAVTPPVTGGEVWRHWWDARLVALATPFLCGAVCGLYADVIRLRREAAVVAGLVVLLGSYHGWPGPLGIAATVYLVCWAVHAVPAPRAVRRADLSYGLYVYAAPVQQLLVLYGARRLGVGLYAALGLAGGLLLATVSWYAVEKPALRLKRRRVPRPSVTLPLPARTLPAIATE